MEPDKHKPNEGSINPDVNEEDTGPEGQKESEENYNAQERNKKSQKNAELDAKFGDASSPADSKLDKRKGK
jgi:hypothetical protein